MRIWKFLHIVSMFTSTTSMFAYEVAMYRAASRRDFALVRRLDTHRHGVEKVGVLTLYAGVAFGFVAALVGGFTLTAPWLLIAYALVVALFVVGAYIEGPYSAKLAAAIEASDAAPSAEIDALMRDPRRHLAWVSALLYVAVIFDMVRKPFS